MLELFLLVAGVVAGEVVRRLGIYIKHKQARSYYEKAFKEVEDLWKIPKTERKKRLASASKLLKQANDTGGIPEWLQHGTKAYFLALEGKFDRAVEEIQLSKTMTDKPSRQKVLERIEKAIEDIQKGMMESIVLLVRSFVSLFRS